MAVTSITLGDAETVKASYRTTTRVSVFASTGSPDNFATVQEDMTVPDNRKLVFDSGAFEARYMRLVIDKAAGNGDNDVPVGMNG